MFDFQRVMMRALFPPFHVARSGKAEGIYLYRSIATHFSCLFIDVVKNAANQNSCEFSNWSSAVSTSVASNEQLLCYQYTRK